MVLFGRTHFNEFAPNEHIATNIVASRLRVLEAAQIITKGQAKNMTNKSEYALTDTAYSLVPIILEFMVWGFLHDEETPVSTAFQQRVLADKAAVLQEITDEIENGTFIAYRAKYMGVPATL